MDVQNCFLREKCECTNNRDFWRCENWCKSQLSAPHVHSAYKEPLGKVANLRTGNEEINRRLADTRYSRKGRGK